mgnify:CR=1 FL=1
MILINRLAASLLFFLPLTLTAHCAGPELLQVPAQKKIRMVPHHSVEDIMRHELRKLENDQTLTAFEITRGGLSAQLVMLSLHYVARLSASPHHVIEANQFDTFIRTMQIEGASLNNIGFKLCLPLSVMLVTDPADVTNTKTSASIVIMPRAHGQPLHNHLESSIPETTKAAMLFELGKSLASFQMAFMDRIEDGYYTASHGDFHEGNIIGELQRGPRRTPSKWSFSLIDCGGMSSSGMHPLMDPLYFIYRANYALYRFSPMAQSLFNLTKNFYLGYLGHLSVDINRTLQAQLPNWRKVATTELARTKGILFFNEQLPNAQAFLGLFEPLHQEAVNSVFADLGYTLAVPPSYAGGSPAVLPCCIAAADAQKPAIIMKEKARKRIICKLREATRRLAS